MRTSVSGASWSGRRLNSPTISRFASIAISRACSDCSTRAASAGDTSLTMSISPSRSQTASSASCGERSLRKTTRSSRAVRAVSCARLASSTTRGLRSSPVMMLVATKAGRTFWIASMVSIVECPSTRVNGPVPHGPGASIAHQWPSPLPVFL